MKQAETITMKAVAIDRFGGPETLTLESLPVPEVTSGVFPGKGAGITRVLKKMPARA
jgi:hypothetical protein